MNLEEMKNLPLFRSVKALRAIKEVNPLRNDLDAYIDAICDYGIGDREDFPRASDYGIEWTAPRLEP